MIYHRIYSLQWSQNSLPVITHVQYRDQQILFSSLSLFNQGQMISMNNHIVSDVNCDLNQLLFSFF